MEGLSETIQLAGVAANFSAELARLGMEGTNMLFKGAEGVTRGVYALIRMGLREKEELAKDPARIKSGSYDMGGMMSMCTRKGVTPGFMRISTSAYDEFLRYAEENKLAYCVLPDLNTHDSYVEVMYPSTQQVQFATFQNNINRRQAVAISFEDYINGADAEHRADMEQMINSLSEEEKEILKNKTEEAEKGELRADGPAVPYEKEISVKADQVVLPDTGDTAQVVLADGSGRECYLTVPKSSLSRTDGGYTVRLNARERIKYTAAAGVFMAGDMIAKETSGQYVVTVPGTHGERYVSFDKRICTVSDDGITVFINQGEKYQILDRSYTFVSEVTGRTLYDGHFNGQMIPAEKIAEYNDNYRAREDKANKKERQKADTTEKKEDGKESELRAASGTACTAEIDARMIGKSENGVTEINTADGTAVGVNTDGIIRTGTPKGDRYFVRLAPENVYMLKTPGEKTRRISTNAAAGLLSAARAKLHAEDIKSVTAAGQTALRNPENMPPVQPVKKKTKAR